MVGKLIQIQCYISPYVEVNIAMPTHKRIDLQGTSIYTIHKSRVGTSIDSTSLCALPSSLVSSFSIHSVTNSGKACPLMVDHGLYCISNLLNFMVIGQW